MGTHLGRRRGDRRAHTRVDGLVRRLPHARTAPCSMQRVEARNDPTCNTRHTPDRTPHARCSRCDMRDRPRRKVRAAAGGATSGPCDERPLNLAPSVPRTLYDAAQHRRQRRKQARSVWHRSSAVSDAVGIVGLGGVGDRDASQVVLYPLRSPHTTWTTQRAPEIAGDNRRQRCVDCTEARAGADVNARSCEYPASTL